MTRRPIGVMLAAAAVGVTACGGSSKKTTTAAQISPPPATTASTSTVQPSAAQPKHKVHKVRAQKPPKHVLPPPTLSTTSPQRLAPPPGKTTVKGPSPISCLRSAGLIAAQSGGANRWTARNVNTLKGVFVDGPYKSKAQAQAAAQSLVGIESAQAGGLYMVSASKSAHLSATVAKVAACLKPSSGSGSLHF